MPHDFEQRAVAYHRELPGLVRSALVDHGVSESTIDHRLLGWDGDCVTIPIRNRKGRVVAFERWCEDEIGRPPECLERIELYGWDVLEAKPERLFFCEGILECLVAESHGLPAVAATGTGRFFKQREWAPALGTILVPIVALKKGETRERQLGLPSRNEVRAKILKSLPQASLLSWPREFAEGDGFVEFFVGQGRTLRELEMLARER